MRLLVLRATALLLIIVAAPFVSSAHAEADGPDYWDVAGVGADDSLNLRTGQSPRSRVLARIPRDAKGLKNQGCTRSPSFAQWTRMSATERTRATQSRWCRVTYGHHTGWVQGRYLVEGAAPADTAPPTAPAAARPQATPATAADKAFGAWHSHCNPSCTLEQLGRGSARPTVLAIDPDGQANARISFVRGGLPVGGTIEIYMDGTRVSSGPVAPFVSKDRTHLVLPADDITLALVTAMRKHRNMVVNFPGEERGIEFQLDQFEAAWQFLEAARRR